MSRTKRAALALVGALALLLMYRLIHRPAPLKPHRPPVPVRVARARLADIPVSLRALGLVQAYRTVTVEPMITGPLIAIDFHQGHAVRRGALLAEIDPRPYRAALAQARAKEAQDVALLAVAQDTLKRYDLLIAHHYIAAEIVAQQKATVAADRAIVAQDRASVTTARTNLDYTRITAPISGETGLLGVNAGNIVGPATPGGIVTITTVQPIYVRFSLPQQDLGAIRHALHAATPNVTVFTRRARQRVAIAHGVLTVLDNVINQATGTLSLEARFPNPALRLWPGAYVNVEVKVRTERGVLVVPSVAVRQGPTGPFVYVVQAAHGTAVKGSHAPTVTAVPVRLGFANQRQTVIVAGLKAGAQVVILGGSRLHSGAAIHILPRRPAPARHGVA